MAAAFMEESMPKWISFLFACLFLIPLTGCAHKKPLAVDFNRELPPGQLAPPTTSPPDPALPSLTSFKEIITAASAQPNPGQYIDQQIRSRFDVYKSIGAPNPNGPGYTDRVLFTGYCTPIYDASSSRHGPY